MSDKDSREDRAIEEELRSEFEGSLPERVRRHRELDQYPMTAGHSALASTEAGSLFVAGHYYGCISLAQAVGEALIRHMCTCKGIQAGKNYEKNVQRLLDSQAIDTEFKEAATRLWARRHDFHHLNPEVPTERKTLETLALQASRALNAMESWAYGWDQSAQRPARPEYWPRDPQGNLQGYVRFGRSGSRLTRRCS